MARVPDKRSYKRANIIAVALVIIVSVMLFTLHFNDNGYGKAVGGLVFTSKDKLLANAVTYSEKKRDVMCVGKMYGYDRQYAYIIVWCGRFKDVHTPNAKMESGFEAPVRFDYNRLDLSITGETWPDDANYAENFQKLFPKPIYDQMWHDNQSGVRANLYDKLLERAKST